MALPPAPPGGGMTAPGARRPPGCRRGPGSADRRRRRGQRVAARASPRREAERFVEGAIGETTGALAAGEKVAIGNFGSFATRARGPRPGRDPKTGEPAPVTARRVVVFRPSKSLTAFPDEFGVQSGHARRENLNEETRRTRKMKPLSTQAKFPAPLPPGSSNRPRSPSPAGVLSALICLPLLLGFAGEARAQGQGVPLDDDAHRTDFIFIGQKGAGSVSEGNRKDFSVHRILTVENTANWGFRLCVPGTAIVNRNPTVTSRFTSSGPHDFELWQWSGPLKMNGNCASKTFSYAWNRQRVDFQIYPVKDNVAESGETITPTISQVSNTNLVSGWASISVTIND